MLNDKEEKFVVCYGTSKTSDIAGWTALTHDHAEAESLIICVIAGCSVAKS